MLPREVVEARSPFPAQQAQAWLPANPANTLSLSCQMLMLMLDRLT